MNMQCPACRWRRHQLINPECPICEGTGALELGAAATSYYTPATVAAAITYSVEAAAREIDRDTTPDDDQAALLRAHVRTLHDGGLIGNRARPPYGTNDPTTLAETAGRVKVAPIDTKMHPANPYQYTPHERPAVRGVPPLSNNGHPSSLARITDPYDLFTDHTPRTWGHTLDEYRVAQLVAAGIEAAHTTRTKRDRRRTAA